MALGVFTLYVLMFEERGIFYVRRSLWYMQIVKRPYLLLLHLLLIANWLDTQEYIMLVAEYFLCKGYYNFYLEAPATILLIFCSFGSFFWFLQS